MSRRPLVISVWFCILAGVAVAQPAEARKVSPAADPVTKTKPAADPEAERTIRERRANAQALLISLAADAGSYNDQRLRARMQARIADVLWAADPESARTLFRKAWDAAETSDKESQQRLQEEVQQQKARSGSVAVSGPPNVRGEVLRLAARRDRALGEDFLAKLRVEKQQELEDAANNPKPDPLNSSAAISQRLSLARQLLDTDVQRALQFADPALGGITKEALNFLSYLRDKDPAAADRRYGMMLAEAAGSLQSDANTVSVLSSYLFTPHLFITFSSPGGTSTSSTSPNNVPPDVTPELRSAFFAVASQILLRPQPPPGQDQSSSGIEGKYLMIKRLLPLFEQYTSKEATEAVRAQMEALGTTLSDDLRQRDDNSLRDGIRPPQKSEDRERALLDQIDRAKTSEERDRLNMLLVRTIAEKGDLARAHDYIEKIDDSELRQKLRAYIDVTMTMRAVDKKDSDRVFELVRTGELTHIQKAWALTQVAKILVKTDREKSLAPIEDAAAEARRIEPSDPDRPRALMAVANALLVNERARTWDAAYDAIKAANSAEGYTGEDGVLRISLLTKGMSSVRSTSAQDFDVTGIFTELARDDYNRTVELARGFEREAPRASAVIAIARAVLEEKKK